MLLEVTEHNISDVMSKNGLVIVDFWSPWCSPCNMLNPVIKSLAEHNPEVTIGKCNTSENGAAVGRFQVSVIPTILFFKDGVLVKKILGYHTEAKLQQMVNDLK